MFWQGSFSMMEFKWKGSIGKGGSSGKISKTVVLKKGENLMNSESFLADHGSDSI